VCQECLNDVAATPFNNYSTKLRKIKLILLIIIDVLQEGKESVNDKSSSNYREQDNSLNVATSHPAAATSDEAENILPAFSCQGLFSRQLLC
ncbi:hypothetical protein KI387_011000, partial [Taxus chinensis]